MSALRLWHCLIVSTIIHITLIVLITKIIPTNHVTMHELEAFMVESPVARLQEPQQSAHHDSGTDRRRKSLKTVRFHPVRQAGSSARPLPKQNGETKAAPSISAHVLPTLHSAQSRTPASVASNTAPISSLPARSPEEDPGSGASIASRQSSGPGQVMVLGDAGSPRFIHKELPIYPLIARKFGKEGKVVLRLAVDAQGRLQGIEIIESDGFGFAAAATAAVRKSTFSPAVKNGRAISSQVLVPIRFVLQEAR